MIKKFINRWFCTFITIITLIIVCPLFVYFGVFNFCAMFITIAASMFLSIIQDIIREQFDKIIDLKADPSDPNSKLR